MSYIYKISEKFLKMEEERKTLPMTLDKIQLTGEQISRLESQGLLKISDKKYCISNMQFEKEEYFEIKKEIIKWILNSK